MKLLIISGFLGAGKTTFIRELIKKAKGDFAIMENEYGAVGVDQDLLKQSDASLKVWELAEGMCLLYQKGGFCIIRPDDRQYTGSGIPHRRAKRSGKPWKNLRKM